jgi:hypothetical protein
MRELKSDTGHLPVRCKHLVEAAKGASCERMVELSRRDADALHRQMV